MQIRRNMTLGCLLTDFSHISPTTMMKINRNHMEGTVAPPRWSAAETFWPTPCLHDSASNRYHSAASMVAHLRSEGPSVLRQVYWTSSPTPALMCSSLSILTVRRFPRSTRKEVAHAPRIRLGRSRLLFDAKAALPDGCSRTPMLLRPPARGFRDPLMASSGPFYRPDKTDQPVWNADCYDVDGAFGMSWNICCKCLLPTVCVMILASCAKRSVSPLNTLRAPPLSGVPGATPPLVTESRATQRNRSVLLKPASKASPAAHPTQLPENNAQSLRTLAFVVPVEDLGATIRDELNTLASTELSFECPSQMRVGFADHARLTIRRSLNNQFRDQLEARGIPASYAAAIVILVDADLTSRDKDALDVFVEMSPDKRPSDGRVWRVRALYPGNHKLNLKVTLSARIPSAGEVQGIPVTLSRSVSVVGGENSPTPYRPGIAGCLAGLLCAWIAWTLWRNRRRLSPHS